MYQCLNGAIPSRKCSIKAPAKWSKWLGPKRKKHTMFRKWQAYDWSFKIAKSNYTLGVKVCWIPNTNMGLQQIWKINTNFLKYLKKIFNIFLPVSHGSERVLLLDFIIRNIYPNLQRKMFPNTNLHLKCFPNTNLHMKTYQM